MGIKKYTCELIYLLSFDKQAKDKDPNSTTIKYIIKALMKTIITIKTILLNLIILMVVSCSVKTNQFENNKIECKNLNLLKKSLIDSLNRFQNLNEVLLRDDSSKYVLYINEVNNKKIGIIAITDSVLFLFMKREGSWIQKDSILFINYAESIVATDLNGDFHDDILIYGAPNMHGQIAPYVFISDNNGGFHYRQDIHLFNIQFDKAKKLIRSYYQGGVYSLNNKEYYYWNGDSLKLLRGVEQNLSAKEEIVSFYKLKNGKRFDYKIITNPKEIVYDTALWSEEY